jgi:hypothetical protein
MVLGKPLKELCKYPLAAAVASVAASANTGTTGYLIGCGAFIELAIMAAAERGIGVNVEMFPNGEPASNELPKGVVFARLT